MKSPKFKLRHDDLKNVITQQNITATWRYVVRHAMQRQYIEDPVGFLDVNLKIQSVARTIVSQVIHGEYVPSPPKRILVEKSNGLCRQIVVPRPSDALVLQCLSNDLYVPIKKASPHPNAYYERERGFSNTAKTQYGGFHAWLDFQRERLRFSKSREFVVITDIANYYDFIGYTQLRNVISNHIPSKRETLLDLILMILSGMLWQPDYMPLVSVGLPQIDLDAPRLLAHAFLYELDAFMTLTIDAEYARYMDDIDLGVDSLARAKALLRDIDLILQSRTVRLNSGKTKILTRVEAEHHFKIRENYLVDALIDRIANNPANVVRHRTTLLRLLRHFTRRQTFDGGNGEKILKRLINLAAKTETVISPDYLFDALRGRPGVREEIFRYIRGVKWGPTYIGKLLEFIQNPIIVDDAAMLNFAYCLVEMQTPNALQARKDICSVAQWLIENDERGNWSYVTDWRLLNASDFGVTQLRPRVVIVAMRSEWADRFSWPEPYSESPPTVGEALLDLMAARGWRGAGRWAKGADEIAPTVVGGSHKHGGPDLGPTRAKRAWAELGVNGLTIAEEAPERNFVGMPRLTVQMVARLQGFPDEWQFSGKKTAAYRQVGNAFPPPVANAVGQKIAAALSGRRSKLAAA